MCVCLVCNNVWQMVCFNAGFNDVAGWCNWINLYMFSYGEILIVILIQESMVFDLFKDNRL